MELIEGTAEIEDLDAFVDRLDEIGTDHGAAIQAFDARYVAGREHIETAVERANRAFERHEAIAEDRSIEILCYAAGRRQINRAMEVGVAESRAPVVVAIDGGEESSASATVRELIEPKPVIDSASDPELIREYFEITEAELTVTDATLEALVIERVSLLVVEK